ncbi:MAG TPA: ATPase P, partial [Lachnospiraceae bacterium]|nr:ATPase P [Lachnospiraceae bacterium]
MNLNGLTEAEVQERLKDGRSNRGQEVKTKSKGQIIRENVLTLFNLLNLFLAIAIASVGSYKNLLFMTIVTANTVIGIVQELRSKKMVDKLSIMVESRQEVVREGRLKRIHNENIVLDDLLHIKRGSQIPVDCRIVVGCVDMNESPITGESDTVTKSAGQELFSGS